MKNFLFRCYKLIERVVVFLAILIWAIVDNAGLNDVLNKDFGISVLYILWAVFIVEMVIRMLPTKDIGVSKIYKKHFKPTQKHTQPLHKLVQKDNLRVAVMVILYLTILVTIGVLYVFNIINSAMVLLIVLLFWVLSEVCVQIFCPFSYLFLGRVCCNKCRFYSWDYAMILLPLIYIFSVETIIVVGVSIVLLILWEVMYKKYPQRFYEDTNENLKCASCTNKNCLYKEKINRIIDKILRKTE